MKSPKHLYGQLKFEARQLLLKGELERYLTTLRAMHELRVAGIGRA